MFLGTHAPRLDEKGRIFLPAKFRDDLADGLVITKGLERCLFVFPKAAFARVAEGLGSDTTAGDPAGGRDLRAYSRVFFASASDEAMDKQGRVTIPPALRAYAGLDRDCTVIGANTRVEIWDTAAWESYLAGNESGFAEGDEAVLPGLM